MQNTLSRMNIAPLLFTIILVQSCDRKFYNGLIAVEQYLWQLKVIDTVYSLGKPKPSAIWYNKRTRLYYVDNYNKFPYPYSVGTYISNFDRK
ncbi:MAG TPA: hypothetical protein VFN95_08740, partial [Flavitalea sp.]|nr:hypothetical protein [Flavitalea sp.]